MVKINCLTCTFIGCTMSDGFECGFKGIDYLDDYIDTENMFCSGYSYSYCLDCEEHYNQNFDCALCNKE